MRNDGRKSLVTIVVTHYEQSDVVGAAIESALQQTVACDVVVVDDGSGPIHLPTLRAYPVKLVERSHEGYAATVKAGVAAASTPFIVILNGDDILHPKFVETLLATLHSSPGARFAYSGAYLFGAHTGVPGRGLRLHVRPFLLPLLARGNHLTITALLEKSVWDQVGGFDPALTTLEDWDFWLRVAAAGITGVGVDEPLFYYRHAKRSSRNRAARKNRLETFRHIQARALGGNPRSVREACVRGLKLSVIATTGVLGWLAPKTMDRLATKALSNPMFAGPILVPVSMREATPGFMGAELRA